MVKGWAGETSLQSLLYADTGDGSSLRGPRDGESRSIPEPSLFTAVQHCTPSPPRLIRSSHFPQTSYHFRVVPPFVLPGDFINTSNSLEMADSSSSKLH